MTLLSQYRTERLAIYWLLRQWRNRAERERKWAQQDKLTAWVSKIGHNVMKAVLEEVEKAA